MSIRQRLVIDANVLRSAGDNSATYPASTHSRDVLKAILNICHKAALSPTLEKEWDKHQSVYAKIWRSAMKSRRKLVSVGGVEKSGLRQKVLEAHAEATTKQEAAQKDFHLVEAAIDTDWIVVSLDKAVRDIFAAACDPVDILA